MKQASFDFAKLSTPSKDGMTLTETTKNTTTTNAVNKCSKQAIGPTMKQKKVEEEKVTKLAENVYYLK